MTVLRILSNLAVNDPERGVAFYQDFLGLGRAMDHGWIVTFAAGGTMMPQVNLAREGGGGVPVPALSIEVDDVDLYHARATALGFEIVYPLTNEPWGVRRFFTRDPFCNIVNIVSHRA